MHAGYVYVGVCSTAAFYSSIRAVDKLTSGESAWVFILGAVLNLGVVVLWLRTIKSTKNLIRDLEAIRRAKAIIDMISLMFADPSVKPESESPDDSEQEGWAAQSTPYLKEMEDVAAGGVTETKEP